MKEISVVASLFFEKPIYHKKIIMKVMEERGMDASSRFIDKITSQKKFIKKLSIPRDISKINTLLSWFCNDRT